jgi:ADP-ribose pyrophosphatase YjhB (NUDIX family)
MSNFPVDCKFTNNNYSFRYRAAGIIVEANETLLAGADFDGIYTYYSVGGAVHTGELASDAVVRELLEETGVEFEIDHLAVIHENFYNGFYFKTIGKICHEISFYFLMKPRGTKELNVTISKTSGGYIEKMHWIRIEELNKLHAYPTFLQSYLMHPHDKLVHIITDNRTCT